MSDLPPPGFPPPGDAQPPRPPQQPAAPLPPPGTAGPTGGQPGIGQPPAGGAPQFGAPAFPGAQPPTASTPIVPVHSGGPKKPWWKGPAGYVVGLVVVAAIVVGIVVGVSGGDDKKTATTDTTEQTDTRPARTDQVDTTSRRTTTTPDTASDDTASDETAPDFTLPDLTNPPTTPAPATTAVTTPATTPTPTTGTTVPGNAGGALAIGAPATVTDDADVASVVVLDVVDDAPAPQFLPPGDGNKLVAVKFRFVNTGAAPLSIIPTFGTTLIDGANQQFDAGISSTTLGPALISTRLVPGDVRVGFVTFEVPKASVAARVQFKLNFAQTGAEWDFTLPRVDPAASPGVVRPAAAFNAPVTVTNSDGTPVAVTALQLVDNAKPSFGGSGGDVRYVAVQFTFTNTGSVKFSDSPEFDVTLIDSDGQEYSTFIFGTDAGPGFDGQVDLSPGDARTGFISFEIPTAATPFKAQIVLSGSGGTDLGEVALS